MKKPKVLTNYECIKMIRKPVAKPSIRMKSKKDYNRSLWKRDSLPLLPGQLYQGVTEEAGQQFD